MVQQITELPSSPQDISRKKILLWVYSGADVQGGHRVQIERTNQHLQELGWDSDFVFGKHAEVSDYDLIHGYALPPDVVLAIKSKGKPVALSTIHWSAFYVYPEYRKHQHFLNYLRRIKRSLKSTFTGAPSHKFPEHVRLRKLAFEAADVLLPNSEAEKQSIISELDVHTPSYVVPNGAETEIFGVDVPYNQRQPSLIYAGRFEPHKNQLGAIRVAKAVNVPLTLVGSMHPHHQEYYRRCEIEAQKAKNIRIVKNCTQQELRKLYNQATVHILPSYFETTGLVTIEALLCGCNAVSTGRGFASDYFGNSIEYCDPEDFQSIVRAVKIALSKPPDMSLIEKMRELFTWRRAGEVTGSVYNVVLQQTESHRSATGSRTN
ncbi:MAG TPA: glycosyltransferase [Drouetiella sp.]